MTRAPSSIAPESFASWFPSVRFEPEFARRIERFTAALAASRRRRDEWGSHGGSHGGHEFIGYRAYTRGDDPRQIDWNLYARLDRAFVRLTRREAGELWSIAIDTSASMGVGPPGKLQRAAEIAAALAGLALRASARVELYVFGSDEVALDDAPGAPLIVAKRGDLARLLPFLESLQAHGAPASGGTGGGDFVRLTRPLAGAARVFILSDLLSLAPDHLIALASARCSVTAIRLLAPHELGVDQELAIASDVPRAHSPAVRTPTEWLDPETGERLAVDVARAQAGYARVLADELERWRVRCARARVQLTTASSATAFEAILARSLRS